jgi:uncharacterized protein
MSIEMERIFYVEGIRLFNAHEYFEAHEAWEQLWHITRGPRHDFYQGLIQAAVALEHYRRSNPRGVLSLGRTFRTYLARVPSQFMGLDIARFVEQMDQALRPVTSTDPLPERGQITFDPASAPQIVLKGDPFEGAS